MGAFTDAAEIDRHVGALFRRALADPKHGPRLRSAAVTLRIACRAPTCELVLCLHEPVTVTEQGQPPAPVVAIGLQADHLDGFLTGSYSLVEGMARNEIEVSGPVSRALRALAHLEPLLPTYRHQVNSLSAPPKPRVTGTGSRLTEAGRAQ